MSKLSRKEFKVLLTEWKQNFINEKRIDTKLVDGLGLTRKQKSFVQEVPIDLNLFAIGDFEIPGKHYTFSYVFIDSLKNSSHCIKASNKSVILSKNGIKDVTNVAKLIFKSILRKSRNKLSYLDIMGNSSTAELSEEMISKGLKRLEGKLNSFVKEEIGLVIYFPRMTDMQKDMAAGTINNIFNIEDESYWKSSLQWELKHDVYHYFEDILGRESFKPFINVNNVFLNNEEIRKILRYTPIDNAVGGISSKGVMLGNSYGDGDNFASIAPYIRSLDNSDSGFNSFLAKCDESRFKVEDNHKEYLKNIFYGIHECYDYIENYLKDKILIQLSHG